MIAFSLLIPRLSFLLPSKPTSTFPRMSVCSHTLPVNSNRLSTLFQGGGRIVFTSSVAANMSGIPDHALYAGSKAAIAGFVRSFAEDYGNAGITVNAIAPAGIKTDMYNEHGWHYVPGGYRGMPVEIIDELHVESPFDSIHSLCCE
jgi:NAD(P)-dependent dehydrogenase (short-subunit alcohol dehydrogenase family)